MQDLDLILKQAFQTGEFHLTSGQLLLLLITVVLLLVFALWFLWNLFNIFKRYIIVPMHKRFQRHAINQEEKGRLERRRQFADYVESEIRRLNNLESWSHYRFTELEAEVEAEGDYRINDGLFRKRSGLRRVSSLTEALESSDERLILLQGEPGSGKSVALRQVVLNMARKVMQNPEQNSQIPLYVNMKHLIRYNHQKNQSSTFDNVDSRIPAHFNQTAFHQLLQNHFNMDEIRDICFQLNMNDENLAGGTLVQKTRELILYAKRLGYLPKLIHVMANLRPNIVEFQELVNEFSQARMEGSLSTINHYLIRDFVLGSLNRANDRDIEAFLEEEFDRGLKEGTWVFVLDSFDEIPDVLSSTEADQIIQAYGDAIADFLGGMNKCRGIVASRSYRGPHRLGWPRFRILPLKPERQQELIRKTGLSHDQTGRVMGHLDTAEQSMRAMSSNPLFLGLVCEFMQKQAHFPTNTYVVYEEYIQERLNRDKDRLWRRFRLEPDIVRYTAEQIAFSMTADAELGLSPTREDLATSCQKLQLDIPENLETSLDALEFLKLARSETTEVGKSKPFTFAHRRFQEYFATSVVLREPARVKPNDLLTDGRWRETAVVLCQTQPIQNLQPIITEAEHLVNDMESQMSTILPNDIYPRNDDGIDDFSILKKPFAWQRGALHLFSVLQDGFSSHSHDLPDTLRQNIGQILWLAAFYGMNYDTKWSLEVAGIVPQSLLTKMLDTGFNFTRLIQNVCYRQVIRLQEMTDEIVDAVNNMLTMMLLDGSIVRDKYTTQTHLARLDQSEDFLATYKFLTRIPKIDLLIQSVLLTLLAYYIVSLTEVAAPIVVLSFLLVMIINSVGWLLFRSGKMSFRRLKEIRDRVTFWSGTLLFLLLILLLTLWVIITPATDVATDTGVPAQTVNIEEPASLNSNKPQPVPNQPTQTTNNLEPVTEVLHAFMYSGMLFVVSGGISFFVPIPMLIYARNGRSIERATRVIRQRIKSKLIYFWQSTILVSIQKVMDWIHTAFTSPVTTLTRLLANLFELILIVLLITISIAILLLIVVYLPLLIVGTLPSSVWGRYFLVGLLIILLWPQFMRFGYQYLERLRLRHFSKNQTVTLTGESFLSLVGNYRHSQARLDFIKMVRRRGFLVYNSETATLLQQISQALLLANLHRMKIEKMIGKTASSPQPTLRELVESLNNKQNQYRPVIAIKFIILNMRLDSALFFHSIRTKPVIVEFAPRFYKKALETLIHRLYSIKGSEQILPSPPNQPLQLPFAETDQLPRWYVEYTEQDQYRLAEWYQYDLLDELCLMIEQCQTIQN